MSFELFKPYNNDAYGGGVIIEEWNGEFFLVAGRKATTVYKKWGYPQTKDNKPLEKAIPWKVKIGEDAFEAIETLEFFLKQLKRQDEPEPDNDVPF